MSPNITTLALLLIPTLCYVGVAMNEGWRHSWPDVMIFAGYSFANVGFMWKLWK